MKHYKKLVTVCVAITMVGILAGCGTEGNGASPTTNVTNNTSTLISPSTSVITNSSGGPADVPPQIDGTISSIQSGNPSYVLLKNVMETNKDRKTTQRTEEKVKLPAGKFVSADHWQSNGDTLDLFIGENFTMMTETGKMMDNTYDQGFVGIVKSINSKEMVIQKVLYDTTSHDSRAMKASNQTVTIHLAPYTRVSINGDGSSQSTSVVHTGDAVLFVLIGPPTEYIATQITDFKSTSAAGWIMK